MQICYTKFLVKNGNSKDLELSSVIMKLTNPQNIHLEFATLGSIELRTKWICWTSMDLLDFITNHSDQINIAALLIRESNV